MPNVIITKSVGFGIAEVEEDFILSEEPMSRLVFRAQIHNRGIRGKIIRQRRGSKDDLWKPDEAIDIRTLGKKESVNIEIDTDALSKLYKSIQQLAEILRQKGVEYGENKYSIVDPNSVIITEENKASYIKKLIDAGYDEDVWAGLTESNPDLVTKLSFARVQKEKADVVNELLVRLQTGNYPETAGSTSWQSWIYRHNWLFGINYQNPIEKAKINLAGIMPDYLFPTLDGFVDILEIKLPENDVIVEDRSHQGAWRWSVEVNTAIGQVVNYLGEIDRLRLDIERNIFSFDGRKLCLLKPRAYILIGNSSDWSNEKKEGLRKLNNSLHGIEVITYKDLYDRGNQTSLLTAGTIKNDYP